MFADTTTFLPFLPGPEPTTSLRQGNKHMKMLADEVNLVIGVDTHKHTNTAAVVRSSTCGAIEDMTVTASPNRQLNRALHVVVIN